MSDEPREPARYGPGWSDAPEPRRSRRPGVTRELYEWGQRHPILDGTVVGPLTFLALVVWRGIGVIDLSLATCFVIALVATALGLCAGLNNRRRIRQRLELGEPESPVATFLGLGDSEPRWAIGRFIVPMVVAVAVVVGFVSAIVLRDG